MDSQQEVSTQTDIDDSDSNNGHKAPQNGPANGGIIIRFIDRLCHVVGLGSAAYFKGNWKTWLVVLSVVCVGYFFNPTACDAGYRLEKDEHKEKCVPCEPNTFMPSNGHMNEACFLCREKEPEGSLTQVNWPCTWTSNAQIGCLREKGKESYRHNGKDSGNCVPCGPRCKGGEIEIQPCTEYTNRKCQRQISGDGLDSIPPEIHSGDSSEEIDGKTMESTTLPYV